MECEKVHGGICAVRGTLGVWDSWKLLLMVTVELERK